MYERPQGYSLRGPRALLSALWVYVLLGVLFRDVHELYRPGYVASLVELTGRGDSVDQSSVLIGGIVLQVPLALVPLSWVLPVAVARWSSVVGVAVMMVGMVVIRPGDADDYVFAGFQLAALIAVGAIALRWSPVQPDERSGPQPVPVGEPSRRRDRR